MAMKKSVAFIFHRLSNPEGSGGGTLYHMRRFRPEAEPLTLSYDIMTEKGPPSQAYLKILRHFSKPLEMMKLLNKIRTTSSIARYSHNKMLQFKYFN